MILERKFQIQGFVLFLNQSFQFMKLQNKVALITGGTTGIGLATAKLFIQEGAQVIITGQNPETLAAAQQAVPQAQVIASNQASVVDIEALIETIRSRYGRLDVLFVNAGIAQFAPLGGVTEAFFDRMMDINFKGAFFTIQAALPLLSEGAAIVVNTSVNAHIAPEAGAIYGASKAALLSVARSLTNAEPFMAKRIRINAVSPGPISTPIYGKLGLPQEVVQGFAADMQSKIALNRFGTDDEIARVALFLASTDSSYVTGAELIADGGFITRF